MVGFVQLLQPVVKDLESVRGQPFGEVPGFRGQLRRDGQQVVQWHGTAQVGQIVVVVHPPVTEGIADSVGVALFVLGRKRRVRRHQTVGTQPGRDC